MGEFETKGLNDEFGSAFDDLDIDAISLFQADFMSDVDLDFLLTGCETQPNNDVKAGNFSKKNSTLASLLKPHPSCGYVPPAPQIHVENNSVIESGTFKRLQVNFPEFETHPQLKCALIQEKTLPTSSGGAGADNANILHCGEDNIGQTFHDISPVASNQRNTQSYQHVLAKTQADGSHFPRQNYDTKSLRRSPHNAIERRYRQSINGKINELREMLNASSGDDTKVFFTCCPDVSTLD
ncbi:unnamed protein product [Hydatigera taeniaeformis]|uniref:BHLH domain-containing protein n=1 Tax=Hydatigena taeniaeformis TaxID=6205 RepID=A0A0R3WRG5_HYDTA|nr:unnamed protein product [Hydatigera taeniaeformis]